MPCALEAQRTAASQYEKASGPTVLSDPALMLPGRNAVAQLDSLPDPPWLMPACVEVQLPCCMLPALQQTFQIDAMVPSQLRMPYKDCCRPWTPLETEGPWCFLENRSWNSASHLLQSCLHLTKSGPRLSHPIPHLLTRYLLEAAVEARTSAQITWTRKI